MKSTSRKSSTPDPVWLSLAEKVSRLGSAFPEPSLALPDLRIHKYHSPTEMDSFVLEPSVCMVVQGSKKVMLGEDVIDYDARKFIITAVDLPVVAHIAKASREKPYLALTLKIDLRMLAQLMAEGKLAPSRFDRSDRGLLVTKVSTPLLNAFHRLLDLLDDPASIPILAPLILREIHFRLLSGEQGARLREIAASGSRSSQIAQAIEWLKENLDKRLRVDELAGRIGMSNSALYQHFQAITAISPLQFQKKLRLNEARRLMLTEHMDAATVSYRVGYESPSQFSREYRRQFGSPPLQDIKEVHRTMSGRPTARISS